MTNQATAQAGEAQPIADANSIDNIIDNAVAESTEATKEIPKVEPSEPEAAEAKPEEQFPKKAVNALSRRDKQIGKQRAQIEQLNAELARFRQQPAQQTQKPANTGEPKEDDYKNFADFIDAKNAYRIEQGFAKFEGKQKETQKSQQEQAWIAQREQAVRTTAQTFIKENPDAQAVIEEFADLADEFSPELQRAFLEADNAPLAFYNLAKEGKLEDLMQMSPARAAMEIGRAQAQALTKPKTKAPTPLPASRGSVAGGKRPEDLSGDEIRSWMRAKS